MICECCPLSSQEDVCPENEGKYGYETADGRLGCRHPRNWVEKRDAQYTIAMGEMGLDMGIEMDLPAEDLAAVIELCKHMVGLDYKRPYHRHGKSFYKAYRNYYCAVPEGDKILDKMPSDLFCIHRSERGVMYHLTQSGLDWLGRWLKIKITQ